MAYSITLNEKNEIVIKFPGKGGKAYILCKVDPANPEASLNEIRKALKSTAATADGRHVQDIFNLMQTPEKVAAAVKKKAVQPKAEKPAEKAPVVPVKQEPKAAPVAKPAPALAAPVKEAPVQPKAAPKPAPAEKAVQATPKPPAEKAAAKQAPAQPKAAPTPAPERKAKVEATKPVREPKRVEPAPKPEKPRAAETQPLPVPRHAVVTQAWLQKQLSAAIGEDKKALEAIAALHSNSQEINEFIMPRENGKRTKETQVAATVLVFSALYSKKMPKFRLYLPFIAGHTSDDKTRESLALLLKYLAEHNGSLASLPGEIKKARDEKAREELRLVVEAADSYTKHYLFEFIPSGNPQYAKEISQLPSVPKGKADESFSEALEDISEADVIAASALYIRRWNLAHPAKGTGQEQKDIEPWEAPVVEKKAPVTAVVPPAPQPVREVPAPQPVKEIPAPPSLQKAMEHPAVAVVGDSISAGGYANDLARLLRASKPDARTSTFAETDLSSVAIRSQQFTKALKSDAKVIVILAGSNDLAVQFNLDRTTAQLQAMYDDALMAGRVVVAVTVPPWKTYKQSKAGPWAVKDQQNFDSLNNWIRSYAKEKGLVLVDLAETLRKPDDKYAMNPRYTGDGLHPNQEGRQKFAELVANGLGVAAKEAPKIETRAKPLVPLGGRRLLTPGTEQ